MMAETRDEILDAARVQMSLGGYKNLNFADIAAALDITRANVHHHFKNKEGLALEVTRQYTMGVLEMAQSMADENPGDFKGMIAAIEKHIVDSIRESGKESACICGQLIKEHDIPDSLRQIASDFLAQGVVMLEAAIIAAQDAGNLPKEIDPNKMARVTHAMIIGIDDMALMFDDRDVAADYVDGLLTEWVYHYRS
jgi:TetR/AcrR family transcriptional repressor of nem operon